MKKVKLIFECESEYEAKVIGLELINATGLYPDKIESSDKVTNWNTQQFIKEIKEPQK